MDFSTAAAATEEDALQKRQHHEHVVGVGAASNMQPNDENENNVCLRWIGRITNASALTILASCNVALFVQLQAVTYRVASWQSQLDSLASELKKQASQTDTIQKQVERERDLTTLHLSGTFVLLACLITLFHMTSHLRRFNTPHVQRRIVAILWMPPVYGVSSLVGLAWPSTSEYMTILKDFYEAYCIYQFLAFLVAVLGGRTGHDGNTKKNHHRSVGGDNSLGDRVVVVDILTKHVRHRDIKPYWCLQCLYQPSHSTSEDSDYALGNSILLECQLLTMQFVFVKPVTSIVTFAINLTSSWETDADDSSPYGQSDDSSTSVSMAWKYLVSADFILLMIQNISVLLAFTGLLKFYHAVRENLLWCHPFSKFMCIKGVVFMTFWQGLVISIALNLTKPNHQLSWNRAGHEHQEFAAFLQNILICLEMLLFSLAHFCVFPVEEWQDGYRPVPVAKPGMGFAEFAQDVAVVWDHTLSQARKRTCNSNGLLQGSDKTEAMETSVCSNISNEATPLFTANEPV